MDKHFGFGEVLEGFKFNKRYAREGWNGKGMFIAIQHPTETSKMGQSYVYMSTVNGTLVPWVASQSDLLAQDWHVVN